MSESEMPLPQIDPPWLKSLEWVMVIGLTAMMMWTTICLGGYLASTMVVTGWAVAGLSALGAVIVVLRPRPLNWAMAVPVPFLIFAFVSLWWIAPAKWLAWREWLLWFQMWIVFVLALHFVRTRRQVMVVTGGMLALGLIGVAMAAYQRYVDPSWMMLGRTQAAQFFGRSAGMFGIPNSLAGLLELLLPGCLTVMVSRSTAVFGKVLCAWLAALFVFAVVLTGSRGGWLGLGGALLLWPMLNARDWRRKLGGAALILALALVSGAAIYRFSEPARNRIQPFLEGNFEPSRPLIWKVAIQIWQDYPWMGSGTASYNVVFEQHRPRGFLNEPDWTHNDYLNTLSDYGVVGFALWTGAGGWLLWLGWRAVKRGRREGGSGADIFSRTKWRLGLFLGLMAYALHLVVDFHTKIPALAFAAALVMGLLLREETQLGGAMGKRVRGVWVVVFGVLPLALVAVVADPLYRAEGVRFPARKDIGRYAATGTGDAKSIILNARAAFEAATIADPNNGQAWADLSYATVLMWHVSEVQNIKELGKLAERAADRALSLCSINAEFWIRKGVALDMQARSKEAEKCFLRALELSPHSPASHYYYAYHLSRRPGRKTDAMRAVESCLALDPGFSTGVALYQHLIARS